MAETKPNDLDAFARISGVGAKKLETYGKLFLEVIIGAAPDDIHPARRKLAGRDTATTYDRFLEIQADLSRGPDGLDKPMSCSASVLAKAAQLRPGDKSGMQRVLGPRHADRFADAFLEALADS